MFTNIRNSVLNVIFVLSIVSLSTEDVIKTRGQGNWDAIKQILSACHKKDPNFNQCMLKVMNSLRQYFKGGAPEIGIKSFDPNFTTLVSLKKGFPNLNYYLSLKNVYEHGWTFSRVTKFTSDPKNNQIIFKQHFPEKLIEGQYDLKAHAVGITLTRKGQWNITLYDSFQTTTITRAPYPKPDGSRPIKVKVEIDKIEHLELHVSNKLNGNSLIENFLDSFISAAWMPGFVVIRPWINELVSKSYTKIWGDAFNKFTIEDYIPE